LIVDGSPGIGCPVIASITGADLVLIVTEPTLSGKHDLERVAQLTKGFGMPTLVCVNKADINPQMTRRIAEEASGNGIKVIAEIPYDEAFTKAQIERKTLIEYEDGEISDKIRAMWQVILTECGV
jgi:MinD superfamily P-loop ATPase